jgi:hypothetical protein
MTSPIDSVRRAARLRRAGRSAEQAEASPAASGAGLPVPVGVAETVSPVPPIPGGAVTFDAQLLGQKGQKRGLRGGPEVIDNASATYNSIEWSGSKDRRARKGRIAKTDV